MKNLCFLSLKYLHVHIGSIWSNQRDFQSMSGVGIDSASDVS